MADLLFGLGWDFWSNALFAFIDIFFGVMLWTVDRRGKRRQDESMKRQDESLDIILEQISKVNRFQTRTLSYAIETLEKDMLSMTELINSKFAVEPDIVETVPDTLPVVAESVQPLPEKPSRFSSILRDQIFGVMDGIKQSLSEIKDAGEKETYKFQKGLEFDLKHVLRGVADLDNFNIPDLPDLEEIKRKSVIDLDEKRETIEQSTPVDESDVEILETVNGSDIYAVKEEGQERKPEIKEKKMAKKDLLSDLEDRFDGLKTVGDYERFAGSILDSIGKQLNIDLNLGSGGAPDKRKEKAKQRLEEAQERIKQKAAKKKERMMQEASSPVKDEDK